MEPEKLYYINNIKKIRTVYGEKWVFETQSFIIFIPQKFEEICGNNDFIMDIKTEKTYCYKDQEGDLLLTDSKIFPLAENQ